MKASNHHSGGTIMKKILAAVLLVCLMAACGTALAAQRCSTRQELISVLKNEAVYRPDTITFQFSSGLYDSIADEDWMGEVLPYAGILSAGWSYSASQCTLKNITYLDMVYCERESDVTQALQGSVGSTVNLHFSSDLYTALSRNSFERLKEIMGALGISSSFTYYTPPQRVVIFKNLEREEQFLSVSGWEELKTQLYRRTEQLQPSFSFHLPEALFDELTAADNDDLAVLENNCGILDRKMVYYPDKQLITYSDVVYYPGKRIVAAARLQDGSMLTEAEWALYREAGDIVNAIIPNCRNEYDYLLQVHDEIIRRCTYTTGLTHNDTAEGALMYGAADCDGYADALYLLCNLAGLECHYQHGDVLYSRSSNTTHMWNGVKLGGQFYCTDVTWDDNDGSAPAPYYAFMNMGREQVKKCYVWDERMALFVPAAANNAYSYYHLNGTAFSSVSDAARYINGYAAPGVSLNLMLPMNGMDKEDAMEALMEEVHTGGRCVYKDAGQNLYVIFTGK